MKPDHELALEICRKWVAVLGLGFHPDTRGADYSPTLSAEEIADYDSDINDLFNLDCDPYEASIAAMREIDPTV